MPKGRSIATLDKYVGAFQKLTTPFFQERVYDIKDVFHRLLWQLRPRGEGANATEFGNRVVLVAREASVMELFAVDLDRLAGVIVEHGGPQSHAAILARSLRIPMVGQVSDLTPFLQPGRYLLVDGDKGRVIVDPDESMTATTETVAAAPAPPTELPAGLPRVEVNLNLLYEARASGGDRRRRCRPVSQ